MAVDHDLAPILLLSDLAEHCKAIAADGRVSLLFDGTAGLDQPLAGPRVSLMGRATRTDDERLKRRFLAHHPDAALYAGFTDFNFYRVAPQRAHLVGGFGKIRRFTIAELMRRRRRWPLPRRRMDCVAYERGPFHVQLWQLALGRWAWLEVTGTMLRASTSG